MARLYASVRLEATLPDATAQDETALNAAIASTLAEIIAISGIDVVELRTYQLELTGT